MFVSNQTNNQLLFRCLEYMSSFSVNPPAAEERSDNKYKHILFMKAVKQTECPDFIFHDCIWFWMWFSVPESVCRQGRDLDNFLFYFIYFYCFGDVRLLTISSQDFFIPSLRSFEKWKGFIFGWTTEGQPYKCKSLLLSEWVTEATLRQVHGRIYRNGVTAAYIRNSHKI